MEVIATFIGLVVTGLLIGVASGLLGLGGGTMMVPLLRLVFGLDAYMATATSLFTIIPTSVSGAIAHVRNKTCYLKLGLALGLGGAVTSTIGVHLASMSPSWAVMAAAALVIIYSAYTMLSKALKLPRGERKAAPRESPVNASAPDARDGQAPAAGKEPAHSEVAPEPFEITRKALVAGFGIGMVAGMCAGYVGLGGGFIMVPLMTSWLGVPMKKASGTSMVAIFILAIPGTITQMLLGHVDYLAGIALAMGSIPGAMLGAKLVQYVSERQLRFIFAGFLFLGGVLLLVKEFVL